MDISFWLNLEKLNRFGQDMLYQWDGPLELTFKQNKPGYAGGSKASRDVN